MEFHALMALCNTVHFLEFVLDLGIVKRTLVACLVGSVCVSVLNNTWNHVVTKKIVKQIKIYFRFFKVATLLP
jgi:hypothetical protein